jgi:hypothetical protein
MYDVCLYGTESTIDLKMSKEELVSYQKENECWVFIDNVHLNEIEIQDLEINDQSVIQLVCHGAWTVEFQEVTFHKPYGEIVNKRMMTADTRDAIKKLWAFADNTMIPIAVALQLTNNAKVEIFDYPPQNGVVINSPNFTSSDQFETVIADATSHSRGMYSLAEIGKMLTGPAVAIDGEMMDYPTITVDLHEQSIFKIMPQLIGCDRLECCGGGRRHDVRMISHSLIIHGKSDNGCWSDEQLSALGIPMEHHLELDEIIETRIGHLITAGNYERILSLSNHHLNPEESQKDPL